jgi:hypothetical protein
MSLGQLKRMYLLSSTKQQPKFAKHNDSPIIDEINGLSWLLGPITNKANIPADQTTPIGIAVEGGGKVGQWNGTVLGS